MKETDIIICLKKTNKGQKNIKKIIARLKNQRNFLFVFFFFFSIRKVGKELVFNNGHNNYCINKYYYLMSVI